MSIESDDVGYAHVCQFLQSQRAVQRLSFGTFVLTTFIQERHDYVDTVRFSRSCRNDTFQILKMIIR